MVESWEDLRVFALDMPAEDVLLAWLTGGIDDPFLAQPPAAHEFVPAGQNA